MSPTHNQPDETGQAQPMQIGTTHGEVAHLIEEIGHSGVAHSPAQVEEMGVIERDHEDNRSGETPLSIITAE